VHRELADDRLPRPGGCCDEDSPAGLKAAQNAGCRYIIIKAGSSDQWQPYAQDASAIHEDFRTIDPASLAEIFKNQ
jgi:beta-phosphoglucomutase-like phosphatase (HAD superfamily)